MSDTIRAESEQTLHNDDLVQMEMLVSKVNGTINSISYNWNKERCYFQIGPVFGTSNLSNLK